MSALGMTVGEKYRLVGAMGRRAAWRRAKRHHLWGGSGRSTCARLICMWQQAKSAKKLLRRIMSLAAMAKAIVVWHRAPGLQLLEISKRSSMQMKQYAGGKE